MIPLSESLGLDKDESAIERVLARPPTPMHEIARPPGELVAICEKAMERQPARRYTSVEAEEHLINARVTFRRRRSKRDMLAAQIFLQAYLDRPRSQKETT